MPKDKHPSKEVEEALEHARANGWQIERRGNGHCWALMKCPRNDPECRCGEFCITSVFSTPQNPGTHARKLKRLVDNCIHATTQEGREED